MGAPPGNRNAARGTQWRDAIRKAMVRGKSLDKLAEALIARGLEGDIRALREIGDRLDGKAIQAIEMAAPEEFRFLSSEEILAAIAAAQAPNDESTMQ